ncbi:MAG TPA: UvrD-helicase domain-containing protein, partial [Terriglobia bacterium]|nr:UvrD-helicase domain-containing protein [Terriglobia bacterium]
MPAVIPFPGPHGDSAERRRIAESLDESLLVEAAAGTGKTTELIRRIVAVLRTGRAAAERLVAVTFTRKAAGELKLRLRQKLDEELTAARRDRPNTGDVEHLEQAIKDLEKAHIGTIHSFCAELLRSRPVEANVDPAFQELSEREARRLYHQAFQRWSQEQLSVSPPGLSRCLSRLAARASSDGSSPLDQVELAGWSLSQWRDYEREWQRRPLDRAGTIDRLMEDVFRLADLAGRGRRSTDELVQALRPAVDLKTWTERFEAAAARDYDALEGRLLVFLAELRKNTKTGRGSFADGLKREDALAARAAVIQALEDFKDAADADLAALLQSEMRELVERYETVKRRRGALDFVDLLLKARDLVGKQPAVRRYFQEQFTHIFVDEFQDTDPLQAELLLLLAADDPAEEDWLNVTP